MSRAFVKEDGPERADLPDLPLSPHPNWVTPSGLGQLRDRLAARQAELAALKVREERLDRESEAAVERDIRYLEARLATAILVEPPEAPQEVAFGTKVTVKDDKGRTRTYGIVGEDEADPGQGLIAPRAPLAGALMGLRPGEAAEWRGGTLTVTAIA